MKKYFVTSDVHSFYKELRVALRKAGFDLKNKDHIWINCGDLLDRGPDAIKCLKFTCNMIDEGRFIGIKGNHEILFERIYERGYFRSHDNHNKTNETYTQLFEDLNKQDLPQLPKEYIIEEGFKHPLMTRYLNSLKWFYELDKYVFVHGWIPFDFMLDRDDEILPTRYKDDWRITTDHFWEKYYTWVNPYSAWQAGILEPNKSIVCGHWATSYAYEHFRNVGYNDIRDVLFTLLPKEENIIKNATSITPQVRKILNKYMVHDIFEDEGIIALDATTAISGAINCLVIEEE